MIWIYIVFFLLLPRQPRDICWHPNCRQSLKAFCSHLFVVMSKLAITWRENVKCFTYFLGKRDLCAIPPDCLFLFTIITLLVAPITAYAMYQSLSEVSAYGDCAILTHHSLDKMAAISQTMFWNAFSWIKYFIFRLKLHWSLFSWGSNW